MKHTTVSTLSRLVNLRGQYWDTHKHFVECRRSHFAILKDGEEERLVALYPKGGKPLEVVKGVGCIQSRATIDIYVPQVRVGDVAQHLRQTNRRLQNERPDMYFSHYVNLRDNQIVELNH